MTKKIAKDTFLLHILSKKIKYIHREISANKTRVFLAKLYNYSLWIRNFMKEKQQKLTILSDSEIQDLYGLPIFTEEEKLWYFSLNTQEWQILELLKNTGTKVYFILQLGYFKARSMFFRFNFQEVAEDLRFIMQQYFPRQKFPKKMISKDIQLQNKQNILRVLKYTPYNSKMRTKLEKRVSQIVARGVEPGFIFREILLYLENQHISTPAYSTIQDIVGEGLVKEQARIDSIISRHMTSEIDEVLKNLLSRNDSLYELTALRKSPKEFRHKEMMQEISKHHKNKNIYRFAHHVLPKLKISRQNIQHYAYLAEHYTVYKLQRMNPGKAKLYLLCFIFYRFQQINDNLVNCLLYWTDKYVQEAKEYAKERIYEYKLENNSHIAKVVEILDLFTDETIPETTEFKNIKDKAFSILAKDKFSLVKQYLSGVQFDKTEYEWEGLLQIFPKVRKNLRPIFLCLDFSGET